MTETTNGEEEAPAVAPNPTWGADQSMFYQTGQVSTTTGGQAAAGQVFSVVRAQALQRAVDELTGDAPRGSGNLAMDVDLRDEDAKAALLEDLQGQLAEAKVDAGLPEDEPVPGLAPPELSGGEEAPADQPPADQPPADQPPADQPPADQPPPAEEPVP